MHQAEHRPENLGVSEFARRRKRVENCWAYEIAVLAYTCLPAIDNYLRAIASSAINHPRHSRLALRSNHRPHLNSLIEPVANPQRRCRFGDRISKRLLRLTDGHRDRNRQATLSCASKRAVADDLSRHLHIGIGQHDHMVLRT